jgi:hypothetical protein
VVGCRPGGIRQARSGSAWSPTRAAAFPHRNPGQPASSRTPTLRGEARRAGPESTSGTASRASHPAFGRLRSDGQGNRGPAATAHGADSRTGTGAQRGLRGTPGRRHPSKPSRARRLADQAPKAGTLAGRARSTPQAGQQVIMSSRSHCRLSPAPMISSGRRPVTPPPSWDDSMQLTTHMCIRASSIQALDTRLPASYPASPEWGRRLRRGTVSSALAAVHRRTLGRLRIPGPGCWHSSTPQPAEPVKASHISRSISFRIGAHLLMPTAWFSIPISDSCCPRRELPTLGLAGLL